MTTNDLETIRPGMEASLARRRDAIAGGMPARGWKIGLNVAGAQKHFGLTAPVVGWLDGRRILPSGSIVDFLPEKAMRVEPEVCLRVGADGRVDAIAPALELVDYSTPPKDLFALLSSSVLHLAAVVGTFVAPERGILLGRRWPTLDVSGQPPAAIAEGLVAADPQDAVDFVAATLAPFGEGLRPGDLILAGSFAATVPPLERGASAASDCGPLGRVSVRRN